MHKHVFSEAFMMYNLYHSGCISVLIKNTQSQESKWRKKDTWHLNILLRWSTIKTACKSIKSKSYVYRNTLILNVTLLFLDWHVKYIWWVGHTYVYGFTTMAVLVSLKSYCKSNFENHNSISYSFVKHLIFLYIMTLYKGGVTIHVSRRGYNSCNKEGYNSCIKEGLQFM